jgi:hypothetical protein
MGRESGKRLLNVWPAADPSRPVWAQTGCELGPGSAGQWPAPTHAGLPLPVVPAWMAITPKAMPAQQGETGALPRSRRAPVLVGEWPGSAPTFPRRGIPNDYCQVGEVPAMPR